MARRYTNRQYMEAVALVESSIRGHLENERVVEMHRRADDGYIERWHEIADMLAEMGGVLRSAAERDERVDNAVAHD